MIRVANIAQMFEAGQQSSQENRKRKTLRDFLQPALGGDQAAMGKVFGVAPEMGMQVQGWQAQQAKLQREQQLADRQNAAKVAQVYLQTRDPGLVPELLPHLKRLRPDMPDNAMSLPGAEEGMMQAAKVLASLGDQPEMPAAYREYQATQNDPGFGAYMAAKNAPKPIWSDAYGQFIFPPAPGEAPASTASPAGAPSMPGAPMPQGNVMFDDAVTRVLGREGGYVGNDAGAGPTNFGINSRANPDVNVASLDAEGAKRIYRERYWDAINADQLPPQIREAAFDTAVNMGPQVALELVQQSGGDPQRFMQLRQQRYDRLVASNPQKFGQYAQGWQSRNQETAGPRAVTPQGLGERKLTPAQVQAQANADRAYALQLEQLERQRAADALAAEADKRAREKHEREMATPPKGAQAQPVKSAQVQHVDRGLERIERALKGLDGGMVNTGPIDQYLVSRMPQGQELTAAVGAIQDSLLALTRVPGVGAQSDLEAKIAALKYPSLEMAPEVNRETMKQLRSFVAELKQALQGGQAAAGPKRISSTAEYDALPSGAIFIAPDGTQRRKR